MSNIVIFIKIKDHPIKFNRDDLKDYLLFIY